MTLEDLLHKYHLPSVTGSNADLGDTRMISRLAAELALDVFRLIQTVDCGAAPCPLHGDNVRLIRHEHWMALQHLVSRGSLHLYSVLCEAILNGPVELDGPKAFAEAAITVIQMAYNLWSRATAGRLLDESTLATLRLRFPEHATLLNPSELLNRRLVISTEVLRRRYAALLLLQQVAKSELRTYSACQHEY